ncbi:hypothetical protein M445_00655 [Vibrio owensii 47666-1]|nr:hypothetical protein M445_00655 [Vibrio owensii 47666-1]
MGMSYLIIGFAQILKLSVAFVSDLGHTNDCVVTRLLTFCVINAINASFSTAEGYIQTVKYLLLIGFVNMKSLSGFINTAD